MRSIIDEVYRRRSSLAMYIVLVTCIVCTETTLQARLPAALVVRSVVDKQTEGPSQNKERKLDSGTKAH